MEILLLYRFSSSNYCTAHISNIIVFIKKASNECRRLGFEDGQYSIFVPRVKFESQVALDALTLELLISLQHYVHNAGPWTNLRGSTA